MTKQEAEAVLNEKHPAHQGYWQVEDGEVVIDGRFNLRELEAIITLMRPAAEPAEPRPSLITGSGSATPPQGHIEPTTIDCQPSAGEKWIVEDVIRRHGLPSEPAPVQCPRCGGAGVNHSSAYFGGSAGCLLCKGSGSVIRYRPVMTAQPKTIAEFMALPERARIYSEEIAITDANRAELEARFGKLQGSFIKIPKAHELMAVFHEPDTIWLAREWILAEDELGLCRHRRNY